MLDSIMIQALTNGLEPRLKLFAHCKNEKDFDKLVTMLEEVECTISTQ